MTTVPVGAVIAVPQLVTEPAYEETTTVVHEEPPPPQYYSPTPAIPEPNDPYGSPQQAEYQTQAPQYWEFVVGIGLDEPARPNGTMAFK